MAAHHWRDIAIAKSEIVTDAWEVTKAWAARVAEWVLFLCMIMNIIEILPGVNLPGVVSSSVLATQVVVLDIAGFGLASMADHARRMGNLAAARRASITGYSLITIMLLTLLVVTVGILWPETKGAIVVIEKLLILARVLMTVIYGHVVHSLRSVSLSRATPTPAVSQNDSEQAVTPTTTRPTDTATTAPATTTATDTPATAWQANVSQSDTPDEIISLGTDTDKQQQVSSDTTDDSNSKQTVTPTRQRVLDYRQRHPDATRQEIATALGISKRTVERHDTAATTTKQRQLRVVH